MSSAPLAMIAPPHPAQHRSSADPVVPVAEAGAPAPASTPGSYAGAIHYAGISLADGYAARARRRDGAAEAIAFLRDEMTLVAMQLYDAHDRNQMLLQGAQPDLEAQRDLLHLCRRVESMLDLVAEVLPIAARLAEHTLRSHPTPVREAPPFAFPAAAT
jgi:hypothetical protein